VAAAAVALACLASCGTPSVDLREVGTSGAGGLDGVWHLDAAAEPADAVLALSPRGLTLVRPCVSVDGTWAARGGLFLADMPDELNRVIPHPGCPVKPRVDVPKWLTRAVGYASAGGGWRLFDGHGDTVATLRPGATYPKGAPTKRAWLEWSTREAGRPNATEQAALNFAPAASLPSSVRAAAPSEVVGRWEPDIPKLYRCDRPYLDLRADGSWTGHDDVGDQHGRWVAGPNGLALGTAEGPDEGDCADSMMDGNLESGAAAVDGWMLRLARLGFRGDQLVLFDPTARELANLTRTQSVAAAGAMHRNPRGGASGPLG
jgi:hypothetical protein